MSAVITAVDTRNFAGFAANLQAVAIEKGGNADAALMEAVRKVLRAAQTLTAKAPSPAQIKATVLGALNRSKSGSYKVSVNFGIAASKGYPKQAAHARPDVDGRVWLIDKSTQRAMIMSGPYLRDGERHWTNDKWALSQSLLSARDGEFPTRLEKALGKRGLSRATWEQIAQDLKLDIGSANYVRATAGRIPKFGKGTRIEDGAKLIVEVFNSSRVVVNPRSKKALPGAEVLRRAIDQARRGFWNDVKHGVFDDFANRARRYPGIFVAQ